MFNLKRYTAVYFSINILQNEELISLRVNRTKRYIKYIFELNVTFSSTE